MPPPQNVLHVLNNMKNATFAFFKFNSKSTSSVMVARTRDHIVVHLTKCTYNDEIHPCSNVTPYSTMAGMMANSTCGFSKCQMPIKSLNHQLL